MIGLLPAGHIGPQKPESAASAESELSKAAHDPLAAVYSDMPADAHLAMTEHNVGSRSNGESNSNGNKNIDSPPGEERQNDWSFGAFSKLKKIVAEAKGAASKPVIHFVEKYLRGTKLIFVVGQSGTGKSTLLSEISGQSLHIGEGHKSGTKNYQICPAIIDDEQYIFVDTAGFGAADIDDMENFYDIIACLEALVPFVTVAGVLFVYGGTQPRLMDADLQTIQWVKCICGPDFYRYITFVTTKWDSFSEDDFAEAWERLFSVLEDPAILEILSPAPVGQQRWNGGHVYHHSLKKGETGVPAASVQRLSRKRRASERAEEARAMIKDRYKDAPRVKLQLVRELDNETRWDETEAAKVLSNETQARALELIVKDNFVRVSPKPPRPHEEPSKGATPDPLPAATPAKQEPDPETSPGAHKPRNDTEGDKPKSKPKPKPERPPTKRSWLQTLFPWIEAAKELAVFFMKARQEKQAPNKGSQGGNGGNSNAWSSIWGTLTDWWSGPPEGDLTAK